MDVDQFSLYDPLLTYNRTLFQRVSSSVYFPGTAKDLTRLTLEKNKHLLQDSSLRRISQILIELQRLSRLLFTDRTTIELIKAYKQQNDFELWDEVVTLNYSDLLKRANYLKRTKFQASWFEGEDMVNSALLRVEKDIMKFDIQYSGFQKFVLRKAMWWAQDQVRKYKKEDHLSTKGFESFGREQKVSDIFETWQERRKLLSEVIHARLGHTMECIINGVRNRRSLGELQKELHLSYDQVKNRKNKALGILRKFLK